MDELLNIVPVTYHKGAYVIIEGEKDTAGEFFIVRDGAVRISKEIQSAAEGDGDIILGPGELFGVISAMTGRSRIETARALTDITLLPVRKDQFCRLIQQNASVAMKIMLQFSKRMRNLNEAFAKTAGTAAPAVRPGDLSARPNVSGAAFTDTDEKMVRAYPKGAQIFREGDSGDEVFVIKSGSVKIVKNSESGEILLAILKTGDIFGEMALLESAPRVASVIAREECRLMVLKKANFDWVIKAQPQLIERIVTLLAGRIWTSYKQIYNTQIPLPIGRLYDMLLINLEKKQADLNSALPYSFDFGIDDLLSMVGLSKKDKAIEAAVEEMMRNRFLELENGKIRVGNVKEFAGQVNYYRKKSRKY